MASQLPADILKLVASELSCLEDLLSLALVNKRHYNLLFAPIIEDPMSKEASLLFEPFSTHIIEVEPSYRDFVFYSMLGPYKHGEETTWRTETSAVRNFLTKLRHQHMRIYSTQVEMYQQIKKLVEEIGWVCSDVNIVFGYNQGRKNSYFRDKRLRVIEHYLDGKLNGEKTTYNGKGHVEEVENYRAGQLHGESTTYSRDVQRDAGYKMVLYRSRWKNGLRDGIQEAFYIPSGVLEKQERYETGARRGLQMRFYEDGMVNYRSVLNNESIIIEAQGYNKNGKLTHRTTKTSSYTLVREVFDSNGKCTSRQENYLSTPASYFSYR